MLRVLDWASASEAEQVRALKRPDDTRTADAAARDIVDAIYARGDEAVREYAQRLDGYAPQDFRVSPEVLKTARDALGHDETEAIRAAADAVRRFHVEQGYRSYAVETWPGVTASRKASPVDVAALYVPAGSAPLVSTLIMLAIPAQLAGVPRIVVVAPPRGADGVEPTLLAAADLLGLDEVYAIGGAQAIAALATGTAGLPRADKIFGPGNAYVAAAKSYVSRRADGPATDLPAGPSEVLVVADESADASFVAADLLSQAEHDPMAQVVLVTEDRAGLDAISRELGAQLDRLPRKDVAQAALSQSVAIVSSDLDASMAISNTYAPEHLILHVKDTDRALDRVRHAGSVFVGEWTPEAAGDYAAGPNHTLPTGGAARAYGGVTVEAFQKTITVLKATPDGARAMARTVEKLAEMEGLDAHRIAMAKRREKAGPAPDAGSLGPRAATKRRKTAETDITVTINLEQEGPARIRTGVGFFDHMLEQVSRHGGFALQVDAVGDLHIDDHHLVEDVCLTFGECLMEALKDRRGIGRFGFELPMDETRAGVWIDLSGRPYCRFEGEIPGERVGNFPVEMAPHAFRSFAEAMKASIHVTVDGENAHHMIEACFKTFGRALRQCVRIEGDLLPSTKEHLA